MTSATKRRDFGLLIVRVGIGLMFMVHGWPKLVGGPEKWAKLGRAMEALGIGFLPMFWGFMAAVAEFAGGLLIALGLLFRPALALLFATMMVATSRHLQKGDGFGGWSHAAESAILFLGLFFIGPGRLALGSRRRGQ